MEEDSFNMNSTRIDQPDLPSVSESTDEEIVLFCSRAYNYTDNIHMMIVTSAPLSLPEDQVDKLSSME